MVVPLTATQFCRIDSDQGKFEFESYGPDMGDMAFSITSLPHADISAAWKRFTDVPEPGPGNQWRWEHSRTGRFFIHVPHWFLLAFTAAIAALPWLAWRLDSRASIVTIAALAMMLGVLIWAVLPPRWSDARHDAIGTEIVDASKGWEKRIAANARTGVLDFSALLNSVDEAIGKRLATPPTDFMESATYQYNGPIEKVLDIVAPVVDQSGFSAATGDLDNAMEQKMKEVMANGVLKIVDCKTFAHPNGEVLTISRMAVGNTATMMLTITYMNPGQLPSEGENVDSLE